MTSPTGGSGKIDELVQYYEQCRQARDLPSIPGAVIISCDEKLTFQRADVDGRVGILKVPERDTAFLYVEQAVGQAVGKNPIALIVPCHRVLGRDGSLHGFAFGLAKKAALLKLEGVNPALAGSSRSWDREVRADSR